MKYFIFSLFLCSVLMSSSCTRPQFTLTGTVVDFQGYPLSNISLSIGKEEWGTSAVTNKDGFFRADICTDLPIVILASDKKGVYLPFTVSLYEKKENVTLTLYPKNVTVKGNVQLGGDGVSNVSVIVFHNRVPIHRILTDMNGSFSFTYSPFELNKSVPYPSHIIVKTGYELMFSKKGFRTEYVPLSPTETEISVALTQVDCISECPSSMVQKPFPDCSCAPPEDHAAGCSTPCPRGTKQLSFPSCECVRLNETAPPSILRRCVNRCKENEMQRPYPDCSCVSTDSFLLFLIIIIGGIVVLFLVLMGFFILRNKLKEKS